MDTTKLESLLFALGRPVARSELIKHLDIGAGELEQMVEALTHTLEGRGVTVVDDGKEIALRVAADNSPLIERVRKEEYTASVGKAGLETLAAILYRGPLTRSGVDFIRGVNSAQTLRTLTMRGLVRRVPNPNDERSYLYEPTTELLATLGAARAKDLPDYTEVKAKLQKLEDAYRAKVTSQPDAE